MSRRKPKNWRSDNKSQILKRPAWIRDHIKTLRWAISLNPDIDPSLAIKRIGQLQVELAELTKESK